MVKVVFDSSSGTFVGKAGNFSANPQKQEISYKKFTFTYKIPKGLVPIPGTNFWVTPDKPIDPMDCDAWPSSPWCGASPFSTKPIDLSPKIVVNPCGVGITLNPVLGFIKLPPLSIVYKNPECYPPLPEPLSIPSGDHEQPVFIPSNGCGDNGATLLLNSYSYSYEKRAFHDDEKVAIGIDEISVELLDFEHPYLGNHSIEIPDSVVSDNSNLKPVTYVSVKRIIHNQQNQKWRDTYWTGGENYEEYFSEFDGEFYHHHESETFNYYVDPSLNCLNNRHFKLWQYNTSEALKTINQLKNFQQSNLSRNQYNLGVYDDDYTLFINKVSYQVSVKCGENTYPKQNNPPPPLPEPQCCMGCCPNTKQDDSLLKLLLYKVDKLSEIVGVDEYPASLPESLISKDEGWLGNLIPNPNVSIPNLTRLLGWYIERFDEIMGQFEIPIEIKDSDPTKPGDQPIGMKLPNVAESFAELMGLVLQSTINTETLINMLTRTLVESGQGKQQGFKTYMLLQALTDYVGFEHKQVSHKLPMLFKPGSESLQELLKECEIDVPAIELAGKMTLKSNLTDLLQAAAIIKAVHWRKLDHKGDMKQQIIDLIKGYRQNSKEISQNETDENGQDKFDKFLNDAEIGFTNSSGISDSLHPYGRNFSERPKIRRLYTPTPPENQS